MKNLNFHIKTRLLYILFVVILWITTLITSCGVERSAPVKLNQLFSNHMVIQQNIDIHVFGTATPRIKVYAELVGNRSFARVEKDGIFIITLPELKAGGPYELVVSTSDTVISLKYVLIGDVWVCSGQSNMAFMLKDSKNGRQTLLNPKSSQLRIIDVPNDLELVSLNDFRNDLQWYRADIDWIQNFPAVAYYFGAELQTKLNVPIGLIGSNWGGTNVEAWTQTQALDSIPQYKDKIDFVRNSTMSVKEIEEVGRIQFIKMKDSMFVKGPGMDEKWFLPKYNAADWKKIIVPGYWEEQISEMEDYDGIVWYRKEFDISKDFVGKDLKIWLSQIHDYDITWLNGVKIGETYSPFSWRGYVAPDSIVKEKNNVLVVRIYNRRNKGGFSGISAYFDYYPVNDKKQVLSNAGEWLFTTANSIKDTLGLPLSCDQISPNDYPSLLYNAMINPMIQFPIKGVIWYQGEANANKAYLYRKTFPAMINNWRQKWGIGSFPFYFVQLADFGSENDKLGDSFWAELREAQSMTLSLPNTGMATSIDIGNPIDIHPLNKTDIGKRLAYNALHKTYGIKTPFSGSTYRNFTINKSDIIIEFSYLGSGLFTIDGKPPKEFIIAGEDQVFYPAIAKIINNTILVSSNNVTKPVSVRYA